MTVLGRRQLLAAMLASACSRRKEPEPARPAPTAPPVLDAASPAPRGTTRLLSWEFDVGKAAVIVPAWGEPSARHPVLVALHGRGEALKGPDRGALGWPNDYSLLHVIERVCDPPLTRDDLLGFVDEDRLAQQNRELAAKPFGGLVIACPYVPDLDLRSDADLRAYGRFVLEQLLPRVYRETPALGTPESTGIDGVSLGGAVALRVGLGNPRAFGAVGALQPAIRADQATELTEIAKAALAKQPRLKLRLLTSSDDGFRPAVEKASEAWRLASVPHEMVLVPGPHDYPFNRGPGAVELLLFHDRSLRSA